MQESHEVIGTQIPQSPSFPGLKKRAERGSVS